MIRLTVSDCLRGSALTGLIAAAIALPAASASADLRQRSRPAGARQACQRDDQSGDHPLPKPPRPRPIDTDGDKPAGRQSSPPKRDLPDEIDSTPDKRTPRTSHTPQRPAAGETKTPPISTDRDAIMKGARQFKAL